MAQLEHQAQVQWEEEAQQRELKNVISGLQEFASNVKDGLEGVDWALRRQIIRTLVKQVEVGHENVNIVYRITPSQNTASSDGDSLQDCGKRI